MLQKVDFEDDFQALEEDRSHLLRPAFYWELFKRRWAYFFIPFVLIALCWRGRCVAVARDLSLGRQNPRSVAADSNRTCASDRYQRGSGTDPGHSSSAR